LAVFFKILFSVSGEERLVRFFLVFLFVHCEVESRAHRFDYEINESEGDGYENRCSGRCGNAGKPTDYNGEIENDKHEMNEKLCKVRFYEFYIKNEIAKCVNGRKKQDVNVIFCFKSFAAVGVGNQKKRIEDHNNKCKIKARMTQKAFKL
jgi:hypothetical protein